MGWGGRLAMPAGIANDVTNPILNEFLSRSLLHLRKSNLGLD